MTDSDCAAACPSGAWTHPRWKSRKPISSHPYHHHLPPACTCALAGGMGQQDRQLCWRIQGCGLARDERQKLRLMQGGQKGRLASECRSPDRCPPCADPVVSLAASRPASHVSCAAYMDTCVCRIAPLTWTRVCRICATCMLLRDHMYVPYAPLMCHLCATYAPLTHHFRGAYAAHKRRICGA